MKYLAKGALAAAVSLACTYVYLWAPTLAPEPATYCEALAATYSSAATQRDGSNSPYKALADVERYKPWVHALDRLQAVNEVYFDPRYTDTAPDVIYGAVLGRCNSMTIDTQINKQ